MSEPGVKVYNHDIAGLYNRLNRFMEEIYKSVSSSGSQMNTFDQDRLAKYLAAITAYMGWIVSQPQLDLPETHPREIMLKAGPVITDVENESVNDVLRMICIARDELVNSQSARVPAGLIKFDSSRLTAMVTKVEAFLKTYIQIIDPLDLPESSPAVGMSGSGKVGV